MNSIFHFLRRRTAAGWCAASLAAASAWAGAATGFLDPLDTPAAMRSAPAQRPLLALAPAGKRLVGVGSRGLIIGSDDEGRVWTQASVPVQTDLLAVQFPTANEGWATGHNGVILHSADAGRTWTKQLDGRGAAALFKTYYRDGAGASSPAREAALSQIDLNYKSGPTLPFLDVWFTDAQNGFVVGSFGMIAGTKDGGKTWEPWLDRIDNPQGLNLNAIREIHGEVYIVGERGQVFRLDRKEGRFTRTDTGYAGSFFGITGKRDVLLAYGLAGTVYRSTDSGNHWEPVTMPSQQTINAGIALEPGRGFLMANAAGQILQGDDSGNGFRVAMTAGALRATGLATLPTQVYAVSGLEGVKILVPSATPSPAK